MRVKYNIKDQEQLEVFLDRFSKLEIPSTGWQVTAVEFKNTRTLAQNRLLFGNVYPPVIEQMGEATGAYVTKDQMHDFFKDMFSPRVPIKVMGKTVYVTKSTTKFTRKEFSDYIEKIYAWGTANGVWWPA